MECTSVLSMPKNYPVEKESSRMKMVTSTKETGRMAYSMDGVLLKTTQASMNDCGRTVLRQRAPKNTKRAMFTLALFKMD